jgi:hypothetical protein
MARPGLGAGFVVAVLVSAMAQLCFYGAQLSGRILTVRVQSAGI